MRIDKNIIFENLKGYCDYLGIKVYKRDGDIYINDIKIEISGDFNLMFENIKNIIIKHGDNEDIKKELVNSTYKNGLDEINEYNVELNKKTNGGWDEFYKRESEKGI